MVVVDKAFGENMNLYATEPFPWDQSKRIYMLEGYHSLHCLVGICPATLQAENS